MLQLPPTLHRDPFPLLRSLPFRMRPQRSGQLWTRLVWKRLLWSLAAITLGLTASLAAAAEGDVSVGIEGYYRVGCWTAIRVEGSAAVASIETRDGDGVEVRYVQPPSVPPQSPEQQSPEQQSPEQQSPEQLGAEPLGTAQSGTGQGRWCYAIPGTEAAPLVLRGESGVIASTRFPTLGSPSRGPAMIPLNMPWLVVAGDPLGMDQIGANKLLDRDALIAVSRPSLAEGFPDSSLGYDGVDLMVLGGSSRSLLADLSAPQQQAIADWIRDGGRVFLTLGESAPELLQAAPWLLDLLPLDEPQLARLDPSAMETFTSSQTPLKPFEGLLLPKDRGRILIMGRTTRRTSTPIAAQYNVGLGLLTVISADLEQELFASWPERLDLITQLTGSVLDLNQESGARKNRLTAYNDLAGQLRSSLDQFEVKRSYGFSFVSLILMALIAAIGPLDYLLLNRIFGRPLLGWITFPLVALGLSALLVYQARPAMSSQADATDGNDTRRCNHVEFVDIDSTRDVGRSFSVHYLYSHEAIRADIPVVEGNLLQQLGQQTKRMLTVPFGYPGESFGGIQIAIEDSRLPLYEVRFDRETGESGASSLRTSLTGLPLASRSSKGLATETWFVPKLTTKPAIERRPGSELLQGELVNPLDVDLLNGMLIYRNWTYLLPTRFPAGGRIASLDGLRQKNFRWQLSNQKALESSTETESWNPADIESLDRIAEMLMFHEAAGGTRYTNLLDGPLSFLDLTHVLSEDRCILMGQVAESATRLSFDTTTNPEPSGKRATFVRLVLPVSDSQRRN